MSARRARSSFEKAKAVVTIADWLAKGCARGEPHPDIARAIERAYRALQVVDEVRARDQVCALLESFERVKQHRSSGAAKDRHDYVRSFIATIQNGDEFAVDCRPQEASEAVIDAALAAWARKRGQRTDGAPDKWTATAKLLAASGFARVEAVTLRKAYERLRK